MAFAESKNITQAAAVIGVSQPQITKLLKGLEQQFEEALFQFQGRRKVLTPAGEQILKQARDIDQSFRRSVLELVSIAGEPKSVAIRIGGRRELLAALVPHLRHAGPVELISMDSQGALEALSNGRIHIALTHKEHDSGDHSQRELFRDGFVLVIPKRFGVASNQPFREMVTQLEDWPRFSYGVNDPFELLKEKLKISSPSKPARRQFDDWRTVCEACNQEQFWSIVPSIFETGERCVRVPVPESLLPRRVFYLTYPRRSMKIRWLRELILDLSKSMSHQSGRRSRAKLGP